MAQAYFETDYLLIHLDETGKVIIAEWRLPPTSQEFRNGMDILANALAHFNLGKVIFDTLCLGVLLESDQEWVSRDWYGRVIKAGYSQVAFIVPADVFTRMSVDETVSRTPDRIPTAYFDNMETATDWIKQF